MQLKQYLRGTSGFTGGSHFTVAAQLTAEEQLECLKDASFGQTYSLSVIPALKRQPIASIVLALSETLARDDEKAAFRVLSTALYGGTEISPVLEKQIVECSARRCAMLRAVSFELANANDLRAVKEAHVKSSWAAEDTENGTYESWYGSILLIEACANGELSIDELLKRADQKTWFAAASRLGEKFIKPMVSCFIHQLQGGAASATNIPAPQADLTFSMTDPAPYPFLSVDETERDAERFPKQKSLADIFGNDDKFEETRDHLHPWRCSQNRAVVSSGRSLGGKMVAEMWEAQTPEEFWRCLTIAKTCMNAGVSAEPKADTPWAHYVPVLRRVRKAALKERTKEREKRLLGLEAPDQAFITLPV